MLDSRISHGPSIARKKILSWGALAVSALGAAALVGCLESSDSTKTGSAHHLAPATAQNELAVGLATSSTYQAESATLHGALAKKDKAGYTGTGYADYQNSTGDYVEWSVSVPSSATYTLTFRFANGGSAARGLHITKDGSNVSTKLMFSPTGAWTTWKTVSVSTSLSSGSHKIRATAVDLSGPNIDNLVVTSGSTSTPPPPPTGTRKAVLTNFTSYPAPGSDECLNYNGCTWEGMFAALPNKMPESWVKANNIISVHEKDFPKYKLHTFRITQGSHTIDAKVYDECADSDCNGCCTKNAGSTGFLIDMEKYTVQRFGTGDGIVNWICLDCN